MGSKRGNRKDVKIRRIKHQEHKRKHHCRGYMQRGTAATTRQKDNSKSRENMGSKQQTMESYNNNNSGPLRNSKTAIRKKKKHI